MHETVLSETLLSGDPVVLHERLIISPCKGRFVPLPPQVFTAEGEWVEEGQEIARIHCGNRVVPVVSVFSGWVMGMLAVPGQPVRANVALFRVRP